MLQVHHRTSKACTSLGMFRFIVQVQRLRRANARPAASKPLAKVRTPLETGTHRERRLRHLMLYVRHRTRKAYTSFDRFDIIN